MDVYVLCVHNWRDSDLRSSTAGFFVNRTLSIFSNLVSDFVMLSDPCFCNRICTVCNNYLSIWFFTSMRMYLKEQVFAKLLANRTDAGQDRSDAGQDECRTGQMQDKTNAGQDKCRIRPMQDRTDRCRTGGMQYSTDAVQDGCWTGQRPAVRRLTPLSNPHSSCLLLAAAVRGLTSSRNPYSSRLLLAAIFRTLTASINSHSSFLLVAGQLSEDWQPQVIPTVLSSLLLF